MIYEGAFYIKFHEINIHFFGNENKSMISPIPQAPTNKNSRPDFKSIIIACGTGLEGKVFPFNPERRRVEEKRQKELISKDLKNKEK